MHSTGIDIVEIERIEKAVQRWGDRFLNRVYTAPEIKLSRSKPSSLAVRFAGKEAVMKALGTGAIGVAWREIEILAEPSGKPVIKLSGNARKVAFSLGLSMLAISLSHSRDYAVAFVVGEDNKR